MILDKICPPALIYLIFSLTQIIIDTIRGSYNVAFMKVWITVIFTILLNFLCQRGLGIISWFIVFIPFILMTLIVSILLLMFGLDPTTGKIKVINNGGDDSGKKHDGKKHDGKKHDRRDKPYSDWELNTSTTGPEDPMKHTDCAIAGGKCGGRHGECCKGENLACQDKKCVVCLSLGSDCGESDLCCNNGKCGKNGKCRERHGDDDNGGDKHKKHKHHKHQQHQEFQVTKKQLL